MKKRFSILFDGASGRERRRNGDLRSLHSHSAGVYSVRWKITLFFNDSFTRCRYIYSHPCPRIFPLKSLSDPHPSTNPPSQPLRVHLQGPQIPLPSDHISPTEHTDICSTPRAHTDQLPSPGIRPLSLSSRLTSSGSPRHPRGLSFFPRLIPESVDRRVGNEGRKSMEEMGGAKRRRQERRGGLIIGHIWPPSSAGGDQKEHGVACVVEG